MRRRNSRGHSFVKRRYKRTSKRKLSESDIQVLDFLWTWKVASSQILKLVAFQRKSPWWAYKALLQLQKENYIQALPRGKYLDQEVWTLTALGFEVVLMDRDDIVEYRFRPHAPAHDYLGTCLQLGDLWTSSWEKMFFTEQMLASLRPSNFPKNFVKDEGHVPDGISILSHGKNEAVIGYEVDLNVKDIGRYEQTYYYYYDIKPAVVFWLVRNDSVFAKIATAVAPKSFERNAESIYSFVKLEDFKRDIWEAKVLNGKYQGQSIRKVHENIMQSLGKENANLGQKPMQEVFFSKFKSPQKSITSKKVGLDEKG